MLADTTTTEKKKLVFRTTDEFDTWIRDYLLEKKEEGPVVFLDSQLDGHPASSHGYIASNPESLLWYRLDSDDPEGVFEYDARNAGSDSGMDRPESWIKRGENNPWEALKAYRREHKEWMFGWFSYDLKNSLETLSSVNQDRIRLPDLCFFIPSSLVEVDRRKLSVRVLKGLCNTVPACGTECNSQNTNGLYSQEKVSFDKNLPYETLKSGEGWQEYRAKVRQIKDYIARGDTYEVNFTHQLVSPFESGSLELFEKMRDHGPVPFAAWISYNGVDVCCASPERFLMRKGNRVVSQPIKGTSPRGDTPEEDRDIIRDILTNEKNKAENVMIVDLVRNDLGKLAKTGSVKTDALLEVQSFTTVHQLVSTVSAEVGKGMASVDIIRACFPMGSMTGAPKIRTMEIIDELETYRRGLYSGAVGYFAPDDDFDFNVVIRTAIIKERRLYYSVGGAITSDSDPEEEWQESWLKARALPINHTFW